MSHVSHRRGFTLIEMLVVIGILAILAGVGISSFSSSTKKAQKAKCQELVSNVAVALEKIYQDEGSWPRQIGSASGSENGLDNKVAYALAKRGAMTLSYDRDENTTKKETTELDKCGIVSPWAMDVIRAKKGEGVSDSTKVPSGGTIADHRLRFAVDTEGKGEVTATVGGEQVKIRGSVMVWCAGMDGKMESYKDGLRRDDVYSWSNQQLITK